MRPVSRKKPLPPDLDRYLEAAAKGLTLPFPEREPGCDDDRLDGEEWEAYCQRKADKIRGTAWFPRGGKR